MPDTKPMPTVTTNATTVPIVVAHRVTPTVIASDKALAARWFRSSPGDISAASALEAKMAAEIAAAREAWGAELERELREAKVTGGMLIEKVQQAQARAEAVAGLVEAADKLLRPHVNHNQSCPYESLRAALERVKGVGA